MRRVKKPRPPVNLARDLDPECSWSQTEAQFLAGLPAAVDQSDYARQKFGELEGRKLREVLYQEQGWLCIYCERQIAEANPSPRVDHWRPLSKEPKSALHWRNLYLSCTTPETCDIYKEDKEFRCSPTDPYLPWPVDHDYDRCIAFTSLGEVYVRSDAPLDEAQRKALAEALGAPHDDNVKDNGVLNLNHPKLVAARRAALDAEWSRFASLYRDKPATREEREAHRAALHGKRPLPQFVSIRLRWLERSLGKGRVPP